MGNVPLADNLKEGVCIRGVELELSGKLSEKKNLNGSTTTIPPRSRVEQNNRQRRS